MAQIYNKKDELLHEHQKDVEFIATFIKRMGIGEGRELKYYC